MEAVLVYTPELASYDLGPTHPLRPERFTLAVALMEAYGLVPSPMMVAVPTPATEAAIGRVHDAGYIAAVRAGRPSVAHGLGTLDTPVFPRMHEAAALVAGATLRAVREVAAGTATRAYSVAGGLHHAHRDRASGFCVYNDAAIAIAALLEEAPATRVLYVDIDAHHGDGVQAAFYREPRVLTVSVHQNGRSLFPGTGWQQETGAAPGVGAAVNVPLPRGATDACYRLVFDELVAGVAAGFAPDLVVAQCGADALHDDPLTDLGLTLRGHRDLVRRIVGLSDGLCGGRLVALGGGGYAWEHAVPRAWAAVAAELAGVDVPDELPQPWRALARGVSGVEPPCTLSGDDFSPGAGVEEGLLAATRESVDAALEAHARAAVAQR